MPKVFKKNRKFNYFSAALILLVAILILNKDYLERNGFSNYIVKININAARPLFYAQRKLFSLKEKTSVYFKTKKELAALNKNLQEENLELKIKLEKAEVLEKENDVLLEAIGEKGQKEFLVAYALFRPPSLKFDTLIINKGEKNGVKKGMKAVAYGNVALGEVERVFENISVIKLLSFYGNSLNVLLEKSGVFVNAVGKGGENFEIILEKEVDVHENETIFLPGVRNFIIGKITKVEKEENMPFQKVYFRFPLNLSRLKYLRVMFLPDVFQMKDIEKQQ